MRQVLLLRLVQEVVRQVEQSLSELQEVVLALLIPLVEALQLARLSAEP